MVRSEKSSLPARSIKYIARLLAALFFLAERVGFEPRPYSRFLKTETRATFQNIFIFLSAVYYVYPVSLVSLVLI